MRTEREAFIRAIIENPRDDAVRLIFADWLEENGEGDYGNFIRVQVGLAKLDAACDELQYHPRRFSTVTVDWERLDALRRRERELLKQNAGAWTDGLPESLVTKECPSCAEGVMDWETGVIECSRCDCTGAVWTDDNFEFRRGFVEAVALPCADFLRHAAELFAAQPVIEVRMTDREPDAGQVYTAGAVWWNPGRKNRYRTSENAELPTELYNLLLPCNYIDGVYTPRSREGAPYQTGEEAITALSAACVTYGRHAAGLSPLPQS